MADHINRGSMLRPSRQEVEERYAELVESNRVQLARLFGGRPRGEDYWAKRAQNFRPGVMDAPEVALLLSMAQAGDTWLDIGAGGGRYAIPLSEKVERVVAVEPSPAMRVQLEAAAAGAGRTNIEVVDMEWPPKPRDEAPEGDVSLMANVLYGAEDIGGFIAAAEAHTRRTCVVITHHRAPNSPVAEIWEALHGEPFAELPAQRELVALLGAMGRRYGVYPMPAPPAPEQPHGEVVEASLWMYHVEAGSKGAAELGRLIARRADPETGLVRMPVVRRHASVVAWPVER